MEIFSFDQIKMLVTSACNLNCKHCYQHFDKNKYSLSKKKIFEIVDFACKHNTRILDLGGGEFFMHPDAYDILSYCFFKRLPVNIATNAINIKTDYFRQYIGTDLLTIQISLDGMEDAHDRRRGSGTWKKTVTNAIILDEMGIPVTANMTLDPDNYTDALEVMKLPFFTSISFTPVAYAGAVTLNSNKKGLAEYEEFMIHIMKSFECEKKNFTDQIFPNVISIKYDGGVYISPVAGDYDLFCFGNINENNIQDICSSFYRSNEYKKMSTLNSSNIDECNHCNASDVCDRGCRLRALKFYGDILKPDPFYCRIFIDEYKNIPISKLFWGIK